LLDAGGGYFQTEEVELLDRGLCAHELHQASIVMLAHDHQFDRSDFAQMATGGVTAKAVKLTTDSIDWDRATRTRYNVAGLSGWNDRWRGYRDEVQAIADDPTSDVMIVRSVADIYYAKLNGKIGAIIASEGAMHLEGQLVRVQQFYDLGWRHTQLFWSQNQLVDGSGLTEFGRQVIAEANRLGILIDVSHAGPALVAQITAASSDPIIRSHDVPNVFGGESSDAAILAVTGSGGGHGVFALHFYDGYLGGASATLDTLVNAIVHTVNVAGIDHVALGGDYFPENGYRWVVPDVTHMEALTAALLERGYSYEDVQKLLGLNLVRLYERVWN
jgi:membrane dipeptidase